MGYNDAVMMPAGEDLITADELMRHIRVLSADEFEGRAPASRGEDLTVRYLTEQFQALGLAPGNPDGSFTQMVPLLGLKTAATAAFRGARGAFAPRIPEELVAATLRARPSVEVAGSPVVFAGYGVVAPEYGWDDFKGMDMTGKTLLVLVNDPGFKGKAMTYYGRWTYKYEIAAEKKAAACIIVHETGPAGYPWSVVQNSMAGIETCDLQRPDGNASSVAARAWIDAETARRLLALGGQDFDALKTAALRPDFRPVELPVKADFSLRSELRSVRSANVVARLEGSDPKLKDEHVIYSAHWDHLGRDADGGIYSGALDDASGVSALFNLARAFASLTPRTKRSILFLATTAEEKGLLGAKYYAENPFYPLSKTVADFNMDILNAWGRTRDFVAIGHGLSTLGEELEALARERGRVVRDTATPEKGNFFRADHFEFAKHGVPAVDYGAGVEGLGPDPDHVRRKREEYSANHYHRTSDTIKPDWDLSGMVEDLRFFYETGRRLADSDRWPRWKPGAEFKDARR
ncbi:MAG: M28 family peptidase [Elusimicrobia bacterium]|nr:M28 family peptidase [Elusimicrobiota bacterium]